MPCSRCRLRGPALSVAVALCLVAGAPETARPDPSVDEIKDCAARNLPDDSGVIGLTVEVEDRAGDITTSRAQLLWQRQDDGLQRLLIRVSAPAKVAGTSMLVIEKAKGDPDLFVHLPELARVKRVKNQRLRGPVLGTDFSYEDLNRLRRPIHTEDLRLIGSQRVDDKATWVLEYRPDAEDRSEYARVVTYVDKTHCLPIRIEFYEKDDHLRKLLTCSEFAYSATRGDHAAPRVRHEGHREPHADPGPRKPRERPRGPLRRRVHEESTPRTQPRSLSEAGASRSARFARAVVARPLWILGGAALLSLVALAGIVDPLSGEARLRVDPSLDKMLPSGDAATRFHRELIERFGSDDVLLVALRADDLFSSEALRAVVAVSEALQALEGVHHVDSLANALRLQGLDGDLEVGGFLEEIPSDATQLAELRRAVLSDPLRAGSLVSRDGTTAALLVTLEPMSETALLEAGLDLQIAETARREAPELQVWVTGTPHVKAEVARLLEAELGSMVPIVLLLMIGVSLAFFRELRIALAPIVSVVLECCGRSAPWAGPVIPSTSSRP